MYSTMPDHFTSFRQHIIGNDLQIKTPYAEAQEVTYADWTASGRAYGPIEDAIREHILPLMANSHTDTNATGQAMTHAYEEARRVIRHHVGANDQDVLVCEGSGMTGVVNKLQRMMGLRLPTQHANQVVIPEAERPVVFITHMEHHSNQTSWLETIAEVVVVPPGADGLVCLDQFTTVVSQYEDRPLKIASVTACSNVTGIETPYHDIAEMMHDRGGYCFVDFACSAPYTEIDMHPRSRPNADLDAIFFSPHKFLGGPGSSGILVVNRRHLTSTIPDNPGGGTVTWTNPWGGHRYVEDLELREDGGTPAMLQTIRGAMAMRLKEQMGVENIRAKEERLMDLLWEKLDAIPGLDILANEHRKRLGIISFNVRGLHHNLTVKLLNDHFGIQVRGGCSCAGTYGHLLLDLCRETSQRISKKVDAGDVSERPGWVRLSIHPTMTEDDILFLAEAIHEVERFHHGWATDYHFDVKTGQINHWTDRSDSDRLAQIDTLFDLPTPTNENAAVFEPA
jgi:selenocysteine lyase/cysteine desulfurase